MGVAWAEVLAGACRLIHSWRTTVQQTRPDSDTLGVVPPMSRAEQPSRRTVLAVAVAAAVTAGAGPEIGRAHV